jgi:hypothetical protein
MGNSEKESITNKVELEIFVHAEARVEVQETFYYYQDLNDGLGFEFMRSMDATLQFIKRNPYSYQKTYKDVRRVLLRKFPYALFYLVEENQIIILGCLHQKRSEIDCLRRVN